MAEEEQRTLQGSDHSQLTDEKILEKDVKDAAHLQESNLRIDESRNEGRIKENEEKEPGQLSEDDNNTSEDDFDLLNVFASLKPENLVDGVPPSPQISSAAETSELYFASIASLDFSVPPPGYAPFKYNNEHYLDKSFRASGPMNMAGPMNMYRPTNMYRPMNMAGPMNMYRPMNMAGPMNMYRPMHMAGPMNMAGPMDMYRPMNMAGPMDMRIWREERSRRNQISTRFSREFINNFSFEGYRRYREAVANGQLPANLLEVNDEPHWERLHESHRSRRRRSPERRTHRHRERTSRSRSRSSRRRENRRSRDRSSHRPGQSSETYRRYWDLENYGSPRSGSS